MLKYIYPRVSYNGYYVSFPRIRRGFDSLHPHQYQRRMPEGYFLLVFRGEGEPVGSDEVEAERDKNDKPLK